MSKLFAFLVGINEYHPQSGVTNLGGCVNDVRAMGKFLLEHCKHLLPDDQTKIKQHIKILTNQYATRENLLTTFNQHFQQAESGDIALFYYCGHGSFEPTSAEFEAYDSKNQNETLVCHDSRLPGHYDLADKELAVLLARIPLGVQRIVILDSCHSASATRSFQEKIGLAGRRQHPSRQSTNYRRPLSSYLLPSDDFYTSQSGDIQIPLSPHILLSGCDRDQTAAETRAGRGLFSTFLVDTLSRNKGLISYNDLYLQVRAGVLNNNYEQSPRVEPYGGFNANLQFLGTEPLGTTSYPIIFDPIYKEWQLQYGAANGMPNKPQDLADVEVHLLEEGNEKGNTLTATITQVNISHSVLKVSGADETKRYKGKINKLPPRLALMVYLNGTETQKITFLNLYEKHASPYLHFVSGQNGVSYELKLENTQVKILDSQTGDLIHGAQGLDAWSVGYIVKTLNQIEKWERIEKLEKKPEQLPNNAVTLTLEQVTKNGENIHTFPKEDAVIEMEKEKVRTKQGRIVEKWQRVHLKISAKNNTGDVPLYCMMLFMSRKYDIIARYSEFIDPGAGVIVDTLPLRIADLDLNEEIDTVKLFFSTQEINPAFFTQSALKIGKIEQKPRSLDEDDDESIGGIHDWFVKTCKITLSGSEAKVGGVAPIQKNGLTITSGNGDFKATLSFGATKGNQRSIDPIHHLPQFLVGSGIELHNNAKMGRSAAEQPDRSVIVLSDIEGEENLKENPLKIQLDQPLKPNEMIMPVTYDGEFILPFGEVSIDAHNHATISISQLPAQEDPRRRSLKKALKFCLMKTFLKEPDKVFLLRWVDFDSKEEDKRTVAGVNDKIAGAKKILLLVHGIIGDTKDMAHAAEFAVKEKDFDLVLTFDYENLTTNIKDIAKAFNARLEAAGLNADDGKELHIIAHSMGGLVTRYMIEKIRGGDTLADRLVMFGTPNGGSRFGKFPKGLNYLLGFALNFLPAHVKSVLDKIQAVASPYTPDIFNTLKMMDTSSEFVKELKEQKEAPATEYYVVAGNINEYLPNSTEGGWVARLTEKLELGLGKLVYLGDNNDIAVAVDDILAVPFLKAENAKKVGCHHLNYFENEDSVEIWKAWV